MILDIKVLFHVRRHLGKQSHDDRRGDSTYIEPTPNSPQSMSFSRLGFVNDHRTGIGTIKSIKSPNAIIMADTISKASKCTSVRRCCTTGTMIKVTALRVT